MSTTSKTTTYRAPKSEDERERRRAYQRAYRAAHKDRVRKWQQTFYLRQAEKLKAEGVTSDD